MRPPHRDLTSSVDLRVGAHCSSAVLATWMQRFAVDSSAKTQWLNHLSWLLLSTQRCSCRAGVHRPSQSHLLFRHPVERLPPDGEFGQAGMGGEGERASSQGPARFHVRVASAGHGDVKFILDSLNSHIDFLSSIGSASQWGSVRFSDRPAMVEYVRASVADSGNPESNRRVFVVERQGRVGGNTVRCGAAIVDSTLPDYVQENTGLVEAVAGMPDFLYLNVLVTDRTAYPTAKGAGDALVEHVKHEALGRGHKMLLVDCWSGNQGALLR